MTQYALLRRLRPTLLLVPLVFCGCKTEEPTYPVAGDVVYKDGEPVTEGLTIWFESTTSPYKRSVGLVDKNGKFYTSTLADGSGSIEGEHRVRFDAGEPGSGIAGANALGSIMDAKYAEFATSGIVVDVKPGSGNLFRIEVERGPRGPKKKS